MEKDKNKPILEGIGKGRLAHLRQVPAELVEKVGDDTFCHRCGTQGTPLGIYDSECLIFICNQPGTCEGFGWASCTRCKVRKPILTLVQWLRHKRNTHKKNKSKSVETMCESPSVLDEPCSQSAREEDLASTLPAMNESHESKNKASEVLNSELAKMFGQRQHVLQDYEWKECSIRGEGLGFEAKSRSGLFFQQEFLAGPSGNGGVDYLVKRALLVGSEMEASQFQATGFVIPKGHAELQIKTAELVFGMTPREKNLTVKVLGGAHQIGYENGYESARTYISESFDYKMNKPSNQDFEPNYIKNHIAGPYKGTNMIAKTAWAWSTRIPDDVNDMRRLYLEGANSIIQNLPYPEIQTDVPGHSYLAISDCIRDFLAHKHCRRMATIPEHIKEGIPDCIAHTSESQRAQDLITQLSSNKASIGAIPALKSYLFFWSDDVEPNRLSKAGRGSVWVATMTIATQPGDGHNLSNTYPIAIGKKGDSHDSVIERVESEMKDLRKGEKELFYVGTIRKQAKILFSDMAQLADQPERRGINFLRLGGRGFTARFGVSANHIDCYDSIRACQECNETNKQRLKEGNHMLLIPECQRCMNWDVLSEGNLGLAKPPENYPLLRDESLLVTQPNQYERSPYCRLVQQGTKQYIKPFRITYSSLKGAVDLAHESYCNHGWSSLNVSAYLKVEGLNDEFISLVLEHATNAYSLKMAQAALPDDPYTNYYLAIKKDAERFPAKYKRVPYPATWNRDGFQLIHNPDVIMHMIFLGIVDDTMQLTQNWLKATKRNTAFIKATAPYLDSLTRLDIQWINVLRYTGEGFGHWVSENYLGFARVMPWFYQNIEAIAPEPVVLPPDTTQKGWTKRQNEHWLKCRGLDTTGSAAELRRRVEENMARAEPPPIIQEPVRKVQDLEDLMLALYSLLECVMSTTVTKSTIMKTRYAVRVFLSAYDVVHASVKGERGSIFSIFNLACLMNLPEAMEMFGPLRQLWEGSTKGEGILRFVKPMMTQGFKHQSNWHYHLLQKLCVAKAFRNILPDEETKLEGVNALMVSLVSKKAYFHKYKSVYDFQRDLSATQVPSKRPISVIIVKQRDGKANIMAVVDTYDQILLMEQSPTTSPTKKFGMHYYNFGVKGHTRLLPWSQFSNDVEEIGYGLLLPLLANGTENAQMFALIGSNWKTLGPSTVLTDLVDNTSATFD